MKKLQDTLLMRGVSKTFPGVKALDNVSFEMLSGEVHSLIGQNGAGKSTLMGILNGITKPDTGEILINNEQVKIDDPNDAFNLNLAIVHQEFALCNNLTVSQNISLGNETYNNLGVIDKAIIDDKAIEVLNSINVNLNIHEVVGNLNTSQWQVIEICKALVKNPKYIVMDEPTASLDENQIENLFSIIKRLKNNGIGIIYISHKLNEIIKISDRITVLKDGKISKVFNNENIDESILIKSMVGDAIEIKKQKKERKENNSKILQLNNFSYLKKFSNINLELRKGEVLGLSGLLGSGTNEILRALFGILKNKEGDIFYHNNKIEVKSPIDAVKFGFGYIPSDRKNEGLIQENSIKENSVLTIFKNLTKLGIFNSNKADRITNEYVNKLQVKINNINDKVMNLSGGNQQKVVIAKWLAKNCQILLFDEPTRGIDVAAKAQIWKLINDFSKSGGAVLVASNEISELILGCDRILTMNKGRIIKIFEENDFNEEEISMCISTS